jgi:hypothetical protein
VHDLFQGCVFTKDINKAILISDAMETGTVQINSAPARGPDHFPFQVLTMTMRVEFAPGVSNVIFSLDCRV